MANVNPPPMLKIPKAWESDPEIFNYLKNKDYILFQLWKRVGGGTDLIENLFRVNTFETTPTMARTAALSDEVEQLRKIISTKLNATALQQALTKIDAIEIKLSSLSSLKAEIASLNQKIDDIERIAYVRRGS